MTGNAWVWVGHLWTARVRTALDLYGDRITDVGIFGWQTDANGQLTRFFDPALLDPYRAKWPHIRWWLTFVNHGDPAIFTALRTNTAAQTTLLTQLGTLLDTHPWAYGIDIDLERGGPLSNAAASEALFSRIRDLCHARGKKVNADLPAMTGLGQSVGDENWCRYAQLGTILDHVCIMSYGMAWAGSAPGPVSPRDWLEGTYRYATSVIPPHKISMGLPAYGFGWRIHTYPPFPTIPGGLRASVATYYGARNYLDGTWVHDPAPQAHIPWLAYRDPYEHTPYALLHVYDWCEAHDYATATGVVADTYNRRPYTTRYGRSAGTPLWSIANQLAPDAGAVYTLAPRPFRDRTGAWSNPANFTLTLEVLKRPPQSALIWDDDYRTPGAVGSAYYTRTGTWSQWAAPSSTPRPYGQARVGTQGGSLLAAHNFGARSLHVQARLQLPAAGAAGVRIGTIRAEITHTGTLRLTHNGTTLTSTTVDPPRISTTPGDGTVVIGLRIRGTKARVYYSTTEAHTPLRLQASVPSSALTGQVGLWAASPAWFDHLRIGDGWWYQPREALTVRFGNHTWTVGRIPRTGVKWDHSRNIFRPLTDVEEITTRTTDISPDWDFDHQPIPISLGETRHVTIRPLDIGCWLGRIFLCDAQGASILHYSDVESTAYWINRATYDYHLDGFALWALGQEDLRLWERLKGGHLPTT